MASKTLTAQHLANALLAGDWQPKQMLARAELALDERASWLTSLIESIVQDLGEDRRPHPQKLALYIQRSSNFDDAWTDSAHRPRIGRYLLTPPQQEAPIPVFRDLDLPQLTTPSEVADWLGLSLNQLAWFADTESRQLRQSKNQLRHYVFRWHAKRYGPPRLIEAPKARLKAIQRKILKQILDQIPLHESVHGFRKGHSCLSFAKPHCGQKVVMRMDLKDFFLNIPLSRVHALFRSLGYPWATSRILTGLCSSVVPADVFRRLSLPDRHCWSVRKKHARPHIPQGAPTSPAIANLCAFRLDCRLSGLARRLDASYTRYADDFAFSGDNKLAKKADRLHVMVASIALEEGFIINTRKTRVMRQSVCQRLTGLVVNRHPNVSRTEFDQLKAMLYNCARHGPQTQNATGQPNLHTHLAGRIAWVESVNPIRGKRLRNLFDAINWE